LASVTKDFRPPGRIAGIDYGTVRLGIALSDARRTLASPYENYTRRSPQVDADRLRRLAVEECITLFVVGLPVHLDGRESQKSREARQFGQWLAEITGVPVEFFDERFSTAEAEKVLGAAELTKKQRKARLDKLAAQILLTAYLEAGGATTTPTGLDD
jgi:putative holliday junction resolvase